MNGNYQTYNPYNQTGFNTQQNTNQPAQQSNIINVINISGGEESAINYMLNPNSTVFFLSSDTSEMFMRGTDSNGMTNLFKAYDIKEKMPNYQMGLLERSGDFATKEDVKNLSNEIQDLKKFLDELTSPNAKG